MVGGAVLFFIGECAVAVLKHETALLLRAELLPVDVHRLRGGRKQSAHAFGVHLHVEHVVAAELVVHHDVLAFSGCCGEGNGGIGDVGRLEEEVLRGDVALLGGKHVVELLLLTVEERHVGVALAVLETLHDSLHHRSTLRGERELHLVVLQHDVLCRTLQGVVEEGCGVLFGFLLGEGFLRGGLGLLFLFCVHTSHLCDGILHEGSTLFFRRRAVEVAEGNQHDGNQDESCGCVLIHICFYFVFIAY